MVPRKFQPASPHKFPSLSNNQTGGTRFVRCKDVLSGYISQFWPVLYLSKFQSEKNIQDLSRLTVTFFATMASLRPALTYPL